MPSASKPSSSDSTTPVTPAMRQYFDAKQQHRDAIVLFRMGDFYEMFFEDALVASRALDLTLTSRLKDGSGRHSDVRGSLSRRRRLSHPAGPQRLSRRDLRAGRRSAKGQGHRQTRGRPCRVARHAPRCGLPRCARTGLPAGASPFIAAISSSAWRSSTSRPASSRPLNIRGRIAGRR